MTLASSLRRRQCLHAMVGGGIVRYWDSHQSVTTATLRRLWINEGKRRGYVLTE